jgi:diaminopropionate ammonia-lyase
VPNLAAKFGVKRVWVKDESKRLGLPSFKILGASWATYQALKKRTGHPLDNWQTIAELRRQLQPLGQLTLIAATDGNHGRAVAHMAALLGFSARILVPENTVAERIAAIAGEGAEVVVVNGSYDDAVRQSAREGAANKNALVISDTAWPGYEEIPNWVIEGYSTIYQETAAQLQAQREAAPDLVLVQMGVGALATSVIKYYRRNQSHPTNIMGVEPLAAACVLESLQKQAMVEVSGPHHSIMAGLNCGAPSLVGWPYLKDGLDLAVAIDDEYARAAMRQLAANGIEAGESGAAGLGGLLALFESNEKAKAWSYLGLNSNSTILILNTEGITDHQNYQKILSSSQSY